MDKHAELLAKRDRARNPLISQTARPQAKKIDVPVLDVTPDVAINVPKEKFLKKKPEPVQMMEQAPYISKGEVKRKADDIRVSDDEPFIVNEPTKPTIIEYSNTKADKKKRSRKNKKDKAEKAAAPKPAAKVEKPFIELVDEPASVVTVVEAPVKRQVPVDDDGDWNMA